MYPIYCNCQRLCRAAFGILVLASAIIVTSCSGGGGTPPANFTDTSGGNQIQGGLGPAPQSNGTGYIAGAAPPVGVLASAPLGTNPTFNTQEISELITTTKVEDTTSSVHSPSVLAGNEERVLWVAIAKRGEPPIAGTDAPPIAEGDEVDLYICYVVHEGELTVSRQWILDAAGLDYIEPAVTHPEAGTYQAIFPYTLAYGTKTPSATFKGVIGPVRTASAVVIVGLNDYREVEFEIINTPNLLPLYYPPANPDSQNDSKDHGKGCLPDLITVDFNGSSIFVEVFEESDDVGYDISNVVMEFTDGTFERWEDLTVGRTGTFFGTGANNGKEIIRCWIKSGCNESGDGKGFGERFEATSSEEMAMAQFAWEDDTTAPDYDYNDFVGRLRIAEVRNIDNDLVQLQLTARAMARATAYDASWQFNIGAALPGATDVIAIVDQYYHDGTRHGPQRIYWSAGGMSIPIFSPTREALPNPEGTYTTNGLPGTEFVEGDYAEIVVILHTPQPQGSYTPMPYEPELLVSMPNGMVLPIALWRQPGDDLNDDGYPQAFIIPDTYAWPLEGEPIWNVYPEFATWMDWIHGELNTEPDPPWWQYNPVSTSQFFKRELFQ